jgi:hypothetical protein
MVRLTLAACLLVSSMLAAKAPPVVIDLHPQKKVYPTSPKALAQLCAKEKPGPAQRQLLFMLEARLRELNTPIETPEDVDAITELMFEKIFNEMSAPTDIFSWKLDDAPRGEVLLREKIKLFPGQNTSKFLRKFTNIPKGKRIDRAFADSSLSLEVSVAKSETDFYNTLEDSSSSVWGAAVHPVYSSENVARVAVQLFSPGRGDPPAAVHQRPVWVGLFQRETDASPWQVIDFAPALSQTQKGQESNMMPVDPKEKITDLHRQFILNLRMADVRYINPARKVLTAHELSFVLLLGLNGESPVDAKKVAWLEPYKASASPLVRAVAILRSAALDAPATPAELASVIENVKALPIQIEAAGALKKLLDAAPLANESERKALAKSVKDVVRVQSGFAMVSAGGRPTFYKNLGDSWKALASK